MNALKVARNCVKALGLLLGGLAFVLCIYALAALVGTIWTSQPEPGSGPKVRTIYVLSNGYHTDIAVPFNGQGRIDRLPVRQTDFPIDVHRVRYVLIGWGSEAAYTSLKAISDLTVGTIAEALSFDSTVVHVLPIHTPPAGDGVYRIDLSQERYDALVRFISGTFIVSENGTGDIVRGVSQGFGDIFYRARYRFSPFYGCNAWTGEALRHAGVRMGLWTPFAQSVEWSLAR